MTQPGEGKAEHTRPAAAANAAGPTRERNGVSPSGDARAAARWPLAAVEAIVIGASAGAVEALSVLLPALPRDLGAAVFIVVHLPRDGASLLADIFAPRCALPVVEARDKEPVVAGTVYFGPPDYHLLLDQGPRLALSVDLAVHHSRPSIDVLFESAADVYGPALLGIILTGANADGAAGLEAVKRAGGTTVVQDPVGAHAASMPQAALKRCKPDYVLSLAQIADLLATLPVGGPT